jgi:hypothetical protein
MPTLDFAQCGDDTQPRAHAAFLSLSHVDGPITVKGKVNFGLVLREPRQLPFHPLLWSIEPFRG